jgi:exosortase
MLSTRSKSTTTRFPANLLTGVGLALVLAWVYWPTLRSRFAKWGTDAQYSHGFLVPVFASFWLWLRRGRLAARSLQPSWWGVPLLGAGLALRFLGTYAYFDWLQAMSLLPCLSGWCLLLGGPGLFRWSWPAIAFLLFMVPLPFRLEVALGQPLQGIATVVSTYCLQTLGFEAFAEGHVIRLGQIRIGVVEACSGLSMLVIFFALATAITMLSGRRRLDKALIILSAIPIALLANIIRITATAILHKTVGSDIANLVFHDLAGWLMMLLALAMLSLELRALDWVLVPVTRERQLPLGGASQDSQLTQRIGTSPARRVSRQRRKLVPSLQARS